MISSVPVFFSAPRDQPQSVMLSGWVCVMLSGLLCVAVSGWLHYSTILLLLLQFPGASDRLI